MGITLAGKMSVTEKIRANQEEAAKKIIQDNLDRVAYAQKESERKIEYESQAMAKV